MAKSCCSQRILVVAGARPNFMKVAPILRELDQRSVPSVFVHTGQHYDPQMSDAFLADLAIRRPDHYLDVGSATHAVQTARVMERFEPVLEAERPTWVVLVGDVNSTLACALVTSKRRDSLGSRIAHVEAGLRSGDWRMPEEVNRVLTDRLSDLLLTPSEDALPNLTAEGISAKSIRFVGNVMIDSLYASLPAARRRDLPAALALPRGEYVVVTIHRPSNVDDPVQLTLLLSALREIAAERPVVFPMHPRTRAMISRIDHLAADGLTVIEPLGYVDMLSLTDGARAVLTDSGGLQEESTVLGVPCLTLREHTERPATVTFGTNHMATWPPTVDSLLVECRATIARPRYEVGAHVPTGWDGAAAGRVVDALLAH